MSMWHKVKERLHKLSSLPARNDQSSPDPGAEYAADRELMAADVSPELNMRLLQISHKHNINKSELIRACINLSLPVLDENPHLVPLLDTFPQKNLNVYKKYQRNIL